MDSTADGGRRPRAAGATERPATVAELFTPARRSLTIGLVSTITLVAFEALAISTIMPTVEAELGQIELLGWVFSGFFLGNLIGIVVVGGLIDRASLTRLFTIALGLFAVGLLVGGLAPSMPVLVAGRVLQGLGGGGIPPVAYVAIGRSMPDRLRPRMFALLSTAWVVPGLMGPWIAANVAVAFNWRVVFLGLLPLLVGAGLIALAGLRTVPTADEAAAAQGHKGANETEHAAAAATARRGGPNRPPTAVRAAPRRWRRAPRRRLHGRRAGDRRGRRRSARCPHGRVGGGRVDAPHPGVQASDPGRHAPHGPRSAGDDPPPRDAHVLLFRGRRLRPAHPPARSRSRPSAGRPRAHRRDTYMDGRVVDPGADERTARHPAPRRGGLRRRRHRSCDVRA